MPPAGMSGRMGTYFLPACSEFKVEFTYDDPRELATLNYQPLLTDTNSDLAPDTPAPTAIEWHTVPAGEIYVWAGLPLEPNVYTAAAAPRLDLRDRTLGSNRQTRLANTVKNEVLRYRWPRALRITLRAYAPGGTLEYPLEHSIVHVWR